MMSAIRIKELLTRGVIVAKAGFLRPTAPVVFGPPLKQFNRWTVQNAFEHIEENRESIALEKNESGFIRVRFPTGVFVPDQQVGALGAGEALRANFWYHDSHEAGSGLGDESVHDHPNPFQSYIVAGGYEHEIYRINRNQSPIIAKIWNTCVSSSQLWELYQLHSIMFQGYSSHHQFAIDKSTKAVSYVGEVVMHKTGVEKTNPGDVVSIDDQMIHRVSNFRAHPGTRTLSLNIVRSTGKGVTNIFLPEENVTSVKTSREYVEGEEREDVLDEMSRLLEDRALKM